MAKSKIIKELANNSISLDTAMSRLMVIAADIGNDDLLQWVENELSGYKESSKVPNYRRINGLPIVYSGINGRFQMTNQPLILEGILDKEHLESLNEYIITEDIRTIEGFSRSDDKAAVDLSFLQGIVYERTGIRCTSIKMLIPNNYFSKVISDVKTKILRVLIMLDKELGNLDSLDIDDSSLSEEDRIAFNQTVNNFIFNDNSVTIGDKNKIDDSTFNSGE